MNLEWIEAKLLKLCQKLLQTFSRCVYSSNFASSIFCSSFKTRGKMTLERSKPALVSACHNTRSFCRIDPVFDEKLDIFGRLKLMSAGHWIAKLEFLFKQLDQSCKTTVCELPIPVQVSNTSKSSYLLFSKMGKISTTRKKNQNFDALLQILAKSVTIF